MVAFQFLYEDYHFSHFGIGKETLTQHESAIYIFYLREQEMGGWVDAHF